MQALADDELAALLGLTVTEVAQLPDWLVVFAVELLAY
jgi:hypothetical protein